MYHTNAVRSRHIAIPVNVPAPYFVSSDSNAAVESVDGVKNAAGRHHAYVRAAAAMNSSLGVSTEATNTFAMPCFLASASYLRQPATLLLRLSSSSIQAER